MSKPTAVWNYYDTTGRKIGEVVRFDNADGTKKIVPAFALTSDGFRAGGVPDVRPLFGLLDLNSHADDAPVFVCEGEKCAAAMQSLGLACVTSIGGAMAANKTDWAPLGRFRRVVILPDADNPGERYAADVAQILAGLPGTRRVEVCRLPGLPGGGDVVDWLQSQSELKNWDGFADVPADVVQEISEGLLHTIREVSEPLTLADVEAAGGDDAWPEPQTVQGVDLPELNPITPEMFPSPLREFIAALSLSLGVDPGVVAASALGCVSTALRGRYDVCVNPDWIEPCHLWTLAVARSGTMKSAIHKFCIRPLKEWEREARDLLQKEIKRATQAHELWKKKVAALQKQIAEATNPVKEQEIQKKHDVLVENEPVIPVLPRLMAASCTPEALAKLLLDNGEAIGLLPAEPGQGLNELLGLYNGGRANPDLILCGHAGDYVPNDRVSTGEKLFDSPRISVATLAQPGFVESLHENKQMQDRGLQSRWLYFVIPGVAEARSFRNERVPYDVRESYERLIWLLLEKKPPRPDRLKTDRPGMGKLRLSNQARELCLDYAASRDKIRESVERGEVDDAITAAMLPWNDKLRGAAARLAGIFHMVKLHEHPAPWDVEIDAETMREAVALCEVLIPHAAAVFPREATGGGSDPTAGKVLDWIRNKGLESIAITPLIQYVRPVKDAAHARIVLAELEAAGWVRREPDGKTWRVNPAVRRGRDAA